MSATWDPDPETPHIDVVVHKNGRMVGLKAGDSDGPQSYPFVQMIGVGTPVDLCQEIDIGDKLKAINGIFLKGKNRSEVHKLVREIPENSDIKIKVIKSFKDKKFITDMGSSGFRVASVRRSNPLLALSLDVEEENSLAIGEDNVIGEDEEVPANEIISEDAEVEAPARERRLSSNSANFDGFGDDDDDFDAGPAPPPSKGGFKRKPSVYGGFGDDTPVEAPTATESNTIDVNGEEFGFSEMSLGDDNWG